MNIFSTKDYFFGLPSNRRKKTDVIDNLDEH
jgi:hypothetical protein